MAVQRVPVTEAGPFPPGALQSPWHQPSSQSSQCRHKAETGIPKKNSQALQHHSLAGGSARGGLLLVWSKWCQVLLKEQNSDWCEPEQADFRCNKKSSCLPSTGSCSRQEFVSGILMFKAFQFTHRIQEVSSPKCKYMSGAVWYYCSVYDAEKSELCQATVFL